MAKGKYQYWLTEDGQTVLRGWARSGLTDEQIAKKMHIATGTLYRWKDAHSEICEALKKGKEVYDDEIVESLDNRAKGYFWTEKKVEKDGKGNIIRITETTRHVPADTTAIIFWLKNRLSKEWRDHQEEETDAAVLAKAEELLGDVDSAID